MEATDLTWRKARASSNGGASCVELAFRADGSAAGMIRDTKSRERGHLAVELDVWRAFLADAKRGELDLPPG